MYMRNSVSARRWRTQIEEDARGGGGEQEARAELVEQVGAHQRPEDERAARDGHVEADLLLAAARAAQARQQQRLHLFERSCAAQNIIQCTVNGEH